MSTVEGRKKLTKEQLDTLVHFKEAAQQKGDTVSLILGMVTLLVLLFVKQLDVVNQVAIAIFFGLLVYAWGLIFTVIYAQDVFSREAQKMVETQNVEEQPEQ